MLFLARRAGAVRPMVLGCITAATLLAAALPYAEVGLGALAELRRDLRAHDEAGCACAEGGAAP